jgi:hypothetical protein
MERWAHFITTKANQESPENSMYPFDLEWLGCGKSGFWAFEAILDGWLDTDGRIG